MYFETIPLKIKKPNSTWSHRRIVLYNSKTKDVKTIRLGSVTDWEYILEGEGWTHWLKPVKSKNKPNNL